MIQFDSKNVNSKRNAAIGRLDKAYQLHSKSHRISEYQADSDLLGRKNSEPDQLGRMKQNRS